MENTNPLDTIPYALDIPRMEARIKQMTDIEGLMNFARNMTMFHLVGAIIVPVCLKAIIHKKLENLIEEKHNNQNL